MTNAQQRRLTGAILGLILGGITLNIGLRSAVRTREVGLIPGMADYLGVAIGVLLLALGVYFLLRFFQVQKHDRQTR